MQIRFVAKTPEEHERGLQHQEPLKKDEIAVFVFKNDTATPFWNKNVSFPIMVHFFDDKLKLINSEKLEALSTKKVWSKKPYKLVIETNE